MIMRIKKIIIKIKTRVKSDTSFDLKKKKKKVVVYVVVLIGYRGIKRLAKQEVRCWYYLWIEHTVNNDWI